MSISDRYSVFGSDFFAVSINRVPDYECEITIQTRATQAEIDRCLSCDKPDCCDCMGVNEARPKSKKNRVDDAVLIELIQLGESPSDIAAHFNTPLRTVYYHINKLERLCKA